MENDKRYDYSVCATCGERIQNIDFRGNPHAFFCSNPVVDPDTTEYGVIPANHFLYV